MFGIVILALLGIVCSIYAIVHNKIEKQREAKWREQERRRNAERMEQKRRSEEAYHKLENEILTKLGFSNWNIVKHIDYEIIVKSIQTLDNYDTTKLLRDHEDQIENAQSILKQKSDVSEKLKKFIDHNEFKSLHDYARIKMQLDSVLQDANAYRVRVKYVSPAGNSLNEKIISINQSEMQHILANPYLLMTQTEYNKYLREQQKEAVAKKQHEYYDKVSAIIDYANAHKDSLIIKGGQDTVDNAVNALIDRTVNSIKKIKDPDSEEWDIIGNVIDNANEKVRETVEFNQKILDYYDSDEFRKIRSTCETLMNNQREFNEYIEEKAQSIAKMFGTKIARNETVNTDVFNYIRPYKKTITPFTAEVSAQVFSSAENNPLEYVVKNFYPNKAAYPEQIQKLYQLIEEIETLKDAKVIIENYKAEYQQYLGGVPDYIWANDEEGFYSRLGFANIDESVLVVEYKFSYTSNGGMAQKSFTVPMTEEYIAELIRTLESKLTASAFAKEQRNMMTQKLREKIKKRDDYTCCHCGNSTYKEPNLLLEIDHIVPIAKGGRTVEDNLQTLCWKCNRDKSDKLVY